MAVQSDSTYITNVPRKSQSASFSKGFSEGHFFVDISADLKHHGFVVTGRLYDRSNIDSYTIGNVAAKNKLKRSESKVGLSEDGEFILRLNQGAKYELFFEVNQGSFSIQLDLR